VEHQAERRKVNILNDGPIKFDGGSLFGQVPQSCWSKIMHADRQNRVSLGMNCLLVRICGKLVLIDTGLGERDTRQEEYGLTAQRFGKGLRNLGIERSQIDIVIFTHLHFDHSGGCMSLDRAGKWLPTFRKAQHYVQRECWEDANKPNGHHWHDWHDIEKLPVDRMELLDGDKEILPGLSVIKTGGHAPGHQAVLINRGGERILFAGDLFPTQAHLDRRVVSAFDEFPHETQDAKEQLLEEAIKHGWLMVFYHAPEHPVGYVERDRQGHILMRPVEV